MSVRNLSPQKVPMPEQAPEIRNRNFEEVTLGYTREMAVEEARRCLNCKNKPCVKACPVQIDIPGFIARLAENNIEGAYAVLSTDTALPAVCGRVCPQETQCEGVCVRGLKGESVAIGRLERFVADYMREQICAREEKTELNGHKVAVIGAGPAGLSCAGELNKRGYQVVIFEALHMPGGVLSYGIPEFRLPKSIVQYEVDKLKAYGVEIELNVVMGKTLTIADLWEQGFEAVFIATGAGHPRFMGIPGETLKGVYSANEYLTRINLMKAYEDNSKTPILRGKRVAVVGGGNVAMDAARCAKRLGADEVYIVYRRGMAELPARQEEVHHAQQEGIIFRTLTNPIAVKGDEKGWVTGLECVEMTLGEPDASGRRRPIEKTDSAFVLPMDVVIIAIGTSSNTVLPDTTPGLNCDRHGLILTRGESGETSLEGVFAGGDAVTGAATVILAMGAGKQSAKAIDAMIKGRYIRE